MANKYLVERSKAGAKDFYLMRVVESDQHMRGVVSAVLPEFNDGDRMRVTLLSYELVALVDHRLDNGLKVISGG